jgi:hypothetical protein
MRTLMEIGVAASAGGLFNQANAIFEGMGAMRPDSEGPGIGLAIARLNARNFDEAAQILRDKVLAKHPQSIEAKMFLGLALRLGGRNAECDNIIKELAASSDAKAQAFAQTLKSP